MLLNDVRNEQKRLAVLLGGSVERYKDGGRWGAVFGVLFGLAILLSIVYWTLFTLVWG